MPGPYTDWNVYLREKDQPAGPAELGAPLPDPMESFQMPTGTFDPQRVGQAIDFMYKLRAHQQESRAAAMRWSGMQDYNRLRQQFESQQVPADEAARRAYAASADRIHYADPAGFARAMSIVARRPTTTMTPEMRANEKLAYNRVTNAEFNARRLQAEYLKQGGAMRMAPVGITKELRLALDELDQAKAAYQKLGQPATTPGGMPPMPMSQAAVGKRGQLTKDQARVYKQMANGDRKLAEQLARNDGWDF